MVLLSTYTFRQKNFIPVLVEQAIKQQELIYLFVPQDELFLCKQELSEVDKRYNALFMSKRNAGWRIK